MQEQKAKPDKNFFEEYPLADYVFIMGSRIFWGKKEQVGQTDR